ncbi:hypothetical protein ACEPPN_009422 [Leptodophora sp. 'Broadleaf-Isolate-01']
MASLFEIPLRPNEALPPFKIVHIIRHGIPIYGADNTLTPASNQQCKTFALRFRTHVAFIAHIISLPLLCTSETAYTALKEWRGGGEDHGSGWWTV